MNQRHAATALAQYQDHCNFHRPHRALGQAAPLRPSHNTHWARSVAFDATTESETSCTNIGMSHDVS